MKTDCFVFDLDGTLCDVTHRRQYVATRPKNWNAWHAGIALDPPHEPVKRVLRALAWGDEDTRTFQAELVLVSGRSEDYRAETERWLERNHIGTHCYSRLLMRKSGDHRADDIIKSEIADQLENEMGYRILAVFEDRPRVLRMWQQRGIFTFDVGQGCADF